jgi:hypothetical protein
MFEIVQPEGHMHNMKWEVQNHGFLQGGKLSVTQDN